MSSWWDNKRRRQRRADWDQIHRLATAGGRTLRQLSDEYHIPYGTLLNRSSRERWLVARLQSNRSEAKVRGQASQRLAGTDATRNSNTNQNANGMLASAHLQPPQPALSSDLSDLLNLVTPDNEPPPIWRTREHKVK
jgi:hypothetical protein